MGYQIAQELGTRYILPSGTLMSHRGAISGLSGQVPGELNARLGHLEKVLQRMNEVAAKRISMSTLDYQNAIVNELWSSGQQAVNTKQADEVVFVKCDKSLYEKTYKQEVASFFGVIHVEYSACPLISSPVKIGLENKFSPIQLQKIRQHIQSEKRRINLTF
jgi:hypothetical protein